MDQGPSNAGGQPAAKRLRTGMIDGEDDTAHSVDAPAAAQPSTQEAPPVCTLHDFWELITGPEATPWSGLLLNEHLGCEGRLALFQACRGGRDTVLSAAGQATLKVAAGEEVQLQAAKAALITRGNLPTTLQLTATDPEQLLHALGALEEGTTWLDELCVWGPEPLPRNVLAIMGRCCPILRALDVQAAIDQLPSPHLFPNLKQLSITDPTWYSDLDENQRDLHSQRVRLAAAPYIKQLTHLTLGCPEEYLPTLLSPANMATQLCSLDLQWISLDDALLDLILQCAPALEQLAVQNIELQSDVHVHTPATWRQLRYHEDDSGVCLSSLACLPDTPPGLLLVCPRDAFRALKCDTITLGDADIARLQAKQLRWAGDNDQVYLDHVDGVEDPAAALRLALSLLRSWVKAEGTPFSTLVLYHCWTMTRELMMELYTGLPHWQRLEFSDVTILDSTIRWLPEEPHLYASLLRLLPDTYRDVTFSCRDADNGMSLTPEQVVSICCGAPVRTAEAPLQITLKHCSDEVYQAVQHSMQLSLIPNVVVVRV